MSQRARLSSEYKDIFPGPSSSEPGAGIEINGVYYFFADDGVHGYELWRSNGTTGGTSQVVDLNASEAQLVAKDDTHMWFAPVNSDNSLCAIWQSDGTQARSYS